MPCFQAIGDDGIDIQKLIPVVTTEGEKMRSGDFVIQIYGPLGSLQAAYKWYLAEDTYNEETDDCWENDGWYDNDGEHPIVKTFAPGEGFMIDAKKIGKIILPTLSL